MELYSFLRGALAWTASVAALWPINVPLAALAYKINKGRNPIGMPAKELWLRSTFAALLVAILTLAMLWLDNLLAEGADFPAGPIHLVIFMAYVPAAAWILFVLFALDDPVQAVSLFVVYIYLPVLVLYALNALFGFWKPLEVAYTYLKEPT